MPDIYIFTATNIQWKKIIQIKKEIACPKVTSGFLRIDD